MNQIFLYVPTLIYLLANTAVLCAQPASFLPAIRTSLGDGRSIFAAGDFNRDGKQDLVFTYGNVTYGNGKAAILFGNGDGSFQPKVDLNTGTQPVAKVFVADVNRDGKLDLIIDGYSPNSTGLLLGKGDGTFLPMQKIVGNYTVLVADFNGDGIPDLLTGSELSDSLGNCAFVIHLGKGDGTFGAEVGCGKFNQGDFGSGLCVGDFNGDGKLDLVWTSARGADTVLLWLGNGDGTLQDYKVVNGGPGHGIKSVVAADFNRDGKLDLLVAGGIGEIIVLLGKGDGTFQTPQYIAVKPWNSQNSQEAVSGDFNGDGIADIAYFNFVLLGNGDGTFQPAQHLFDAAVGSYAIAAADFNGDGKADLIFLDDGQSVYTATSFSLFLSKVPASPSHEQVAYSAANGASFLAPGSIASIFAKNPATNAASASTDVPPTNLGGVSLRIRDNTGAVQPAPLYYVSPTQINFVVPETIPIGLVTLTVDDGTLPLGEGPNATYINDISPAFFMMNPQGTAAATALRIRSDGTRESVPVFNCGSTGECTSTPIDLSSGDAFYLSLYGTGFRHRQSPTTANQRPGEICQVGGIDAAVQYSGAQGTVPGMDQINLLLPKSLPSGIATVSCRFVGKLELVNYFSTDSFNDRRWPSNQIQILIK